MLKTVALVGAVMGLAGQASAWTREANTEKDTLACTSPQSRKIAERSMNDSQLDSIGCVRIGNPIPVSFDHDERTHSRGPMPITVKTPNQVFRLYVYEWDVKPTDGYP
jgi:hypothetical protein